MPTIVTANNILNIMRSWLGYGVANGKFKEIIDLYNSYKPLPRGYKVQYTDQWCATTTSAAAIKAGAVDLIGVECSCNELIKYYQKIGIWIEDGTIIPIPGDIILYHWGVKVQPNNDLADHIGFVETVNSVSKLIVAIEGNKDKMVARRSIPIGDGAIRGFARPLYAAASTVSAPKEVVDISEGKILYDKLIAYLNSLSTSEYATIASEVAIKKGWFTDGTGDGLVDNPRAFLTRQDLAIVLNNGGLFK